MSQFTLPLLGTCACLILAAAPAFANTACNDHAVITERLATSYGESRHAMGLGRNNTMIEVYSSEESGSWTILVTRPGGPTCMVAAGEAFQVLNELLEEDDNVMIRKNSFSGITRTSRTPAKTPITAGTNKTSVVRRFVTES